MFQLFLFELQETHIEGDSVDTPYHIDIRPSDWTGNTSPYSISQTQNDSSTDTCSVHSNFEGSCSLRKPP